MFSKNIWWNCRRGTDGLDEHNASCCSPVSKASSTLYKVCYCCKSQVNSLSCFKSKLSHVFFPPLYHLIPALVPVCDYTSEGDLQVLAVWAQCPCPLFQVIVCSATLHSFDVKKLSERIMHFPTWVDLKGEDSVPETVHHVVVPVNPKTDRLWERLGKNHIRVSLLSRAKDSQRGGRKIQLGFALLLMHCGGINTFYFFKLLCCYFSQLRMCWQIGVGITRGPVIRYCHAT